MKTAILTIVSGEKYKQIWDRAKPFFENYADKLDADLIVLEDAKFVPTAHWLKFSIYEFLKKDYDRVAFIDADILIRPDSPSLFDEVPEDEFGVFNEGEYLPRAICMYEIMHAYGINLPRWNGNAYYNTGVMVVSREHRHIFRPPGNVKQIRNAFGEQTFINLRLFESEAKIHNLNYRFNSMSVMDRATGMTRLDSYFMHYAGWEAASSGKRDILKDMDADIARWKPPYEYKRNIFVYTGGGIGDQVCAEPVYRAMCNKYYPDANIYVKAPFPELFDHLPVIASKEYPTDGFDAMYEMNAHPSTIHNRHLQAQHAFIHAVDYVSIACLGRVLPNEDKRIVLKFSLEDLENVQKIAGDGVDLNDLTLVHPGFGWKSKTFPTAWWQEVIDNIPGTVGIIGKAINEKHSYINVTCPKGGIDFRDKISINELIALISQANIVITNDSAPVHIAGAFNHDIILIPTCKHPDFILPYREGSKTYKTHTLYRKLLCHTVKRGDLPTDDINWSIHELPGPIEDFLPEPGEVIEKVEEIKFYQQLKSDFSYWGKEEQENDSIMQSD